MADVGRIPLGVSSEETPTPPASEIKSPSRSSVVTIEVPYTDYEREHNHPYSVDYFNLGDTWNDNAGGFPKEIARIEGYIAQKINSGELANSVGAIKDFMKDMEKFNNLTKEERPVVKIEILSNYIEFLMKNEQVKSNLRRYHGTS